MRRRAGFRSGLGTGLLLGIGFFVALALGIGLLVLGLVLGRASRQSVATRPTATATVAASPLPLPTATVAVVPTVAPLPTATSLPTATPLLPTEVPPTATPLPALAVAGADGANIRSGPGTNFSVVGRASPGTQLPIIGRYADWWQVLYNDAPAWVSSAVVTASNVENVPQVVPPASPVPPPAAPAAPAAATAAPQQPTATPGNFRGLVPNAYWVEGAPGPYTVNQEIWFNLDVTNTSGQPLDYLAFGTWVAETGQFQKSYSYSSFAAGQRFTWRDHLHIPAAGTYNLWMAIQFADGSSALLMGPVTITVNP